MPINRPLAQKVLAVVCIIMIAATSSLLLPSFVFAQSSGGGGGSGSGTTVPIGTGFDFNNIMKHLKDFVLDHLAVIVAKQILHQMTVSVINWINTGFKGSPAFLTNPDAYFLDAADQATGAFIAQNGPLSQLCSPFGVDIQISLAMQQGSLLSQRYACTLGSIISSAQNLPNNITVNGQNINGFMNGDFSQGGWPAFIALTTEPQNNPYGAYLMAQSDLQASISAKNTSIKADLSMGNGFMSWQDCKTVPVTGSSGSQQTSSSFNITSGVYNNAGSSNDLSLQSGVTSNALNQSSNGFSIQSGVAQQASGQQVCTTETPGSVISGTLQKQLNVPADELELANDINAVINATITQLTSTMLQKGLASLSSGGSNSYTSKIGKSAGPLFISSKSLDNAISSLQASQDSYNGAINDLTSTRSDYITVQTCFVSFLSSTTNATVNQQSIALLNSNAINNTITGVINPLISTLQQKIDDISQQIQQVQTLLATTTLDFTKIIPDSATSTDTLLASENTYLQNFQNIIEGATSQTGKKQSKQDVDDAEKQVTAMNKDVKALQKVCKQLKSHP